jgi:hypothetical protein
MARHTGTVLAVTAAVALFGSSAWSKDAKPWLKGIGAPALTDSQRDQITRDGANFAKAGFLDRSTVTAPPDEMLQKIQAEEARAATAGPVVMRRFFPLNPILERQAPASAKPVPTALLGAGAANYISISSERSLRLYTGTALGNVLVKEVVGAELRAMAAAPKPDFVVGNVPVYVSTVRYAGGTWVTEAIANPAGKIVHVFFQTRVDSPAKSEAMRSWLQAVLGA